MTITSTFYHRFRSVLFQLDPEFSHNLALRLLAMAAQFPFSNKWMNLKSDSEYARLATDVFGIHFPNPIGIAAGYDKNAFGARSLSLLGVGHVEVGTITLMPQYGNPRPRLFRLIEDDALINSMGFPSAGATAVAKHLTKARLKPMRSKIGVNIGKGCDTPLESAISDYSGLLQELHPYADYMTINISSPNTVGLRKLQEREALQHLLVELQKIRTEKCPNMPLLVKLAPDLSLNEVDEALELIIDCGLSGIIATNATVDRTGLKAPDRHKPGGLSGPPLREQSTRIIRHIYQQTNGVIPIIGVGGVDSPDAALEKIRAGASLVQVYTGLVYHGPSLVQAINSGIVKEMKTLGAQTINELVGTKA